MNKRLLLLVGTIIMCGCGAFMLFKTSPQKNIEQALSHVMQGHYSEAEALLAEEPTPIYTSLYRAYIEQIRGRFEVADRLLKVAYKEASRSNQRDVLAEIALAQAANAFAKGNDAELEAYLQTATLINPEGLALPLFEGLGYYLHHSYADTLRTLNISSNEACSPSNNPWLHASLNALFPTAWKKMVLTHCCIEEGDFLSAREIIEKENRMAQTQHSHLATLLLGLSYLKEAQQVAIDQRESYYKLAQFYFARAAMDDSTFRVKQRVIVHLENEAAHILLAQMHGALRQWGFDFIHTLINWKADASIERLTELLARNLLQQKNEEACHLCAAIREEFHGTPFHLMLTEKMLAALSQELKGGEAEDLFGLWALVEKLAPSPLMAAKRVAALTSEEIFETIKKDNLSLSRTRAFLAFWEKLGRTSLEREVLARELLVFSKTFWHYEQQEQKGQNLMEIALNMSKKSPFVESEITLFLTSLFQQAENSNMIARMLLVYEAMGKFQINPQEIVSKSTIANHLADASYLYRARNYAAATTHAGWVLKLDPHNETALRVAGLASFQMGEYGHALAFLKQLSTPDEETNNAVMLSQVFASQDQVKHLCQTDPSGNYESAE